MAAEATERFDPDGGNNPKGEWRLWKQPEAPAGGDATGQKRRSGRNRGEPEAVVEQKGRTGEEVGRRGSEGTGQDH